METIFLISQVLLYIEYIEEEPLETIDKIALWVISIITSILFIHFTKKLIKKIYSNINNFKFKIMKTQSQSKKENLKEVNWNPVLWGTIFIGVIIVVVILIFCNACCEKKQDEINSLKKELVLVKKENDSLRNQLTNLTNILKRIESKNDSILKKQKQTDSLIIYLISEIKTQKSEINKLKNEISELDSLGNKNDLISEKLNTISIKLDSCCQDKKEKSTECCIKIEVESQKQNQTTTIFSEEVNCSELQKGKEYILHNEKDYSGIQETIKNFLKKENALGFSELALGAGCLIASEFIPKKTTTYARPINVNVGGTDISTNVSFTKKETAPAEYVLKGIGITGIVLGGLELADIKLFNLGKKIQGEINLLQSQEIIKLSIPIK